MPETVAIQRAIVELERQQIYSFSKDSPLRDRHPDAFTAAEVAEFDQKVLEDYSVAKRILESVRIVLDVTCDAA